MKISLLAAGVTTALSITALSLYLNGCGGGGGSETETNSPAPTPIPAPMPTPPPVNTGSLNGEFVSPTLFGNPYSHIPAQCYIETSRGAQNACQYCHTNGPYTIKLGNNLPQAGEDIRIGNLQLDYSFAPHSRFAPLATINHWENTLTPEKLRAAVAAQGIDPTSWDMQAYVRQDNWSSAFAQRPGDLKSWDGAADSPFRLLPALDPADLPAKADGFVRSSNEKHGFFNDGQGSNASWITGWRAVNFMPYGIFTPMTGSVSGIYIRLPAKFMLTEGGEFSLDIYKRNLDLVERAIQDRLRFEDSTHYLGLAKDAAVERGLYPVGTEFAHPLHYVDVQADGSDLAVSPFPGTRSRRVKEVRYMYKWKNFYHEQFRPGEREEGLPVYGNSAQGWVDNGVGWYLAGFIEDKNGALRPQNIEEMTQCIGCHSGVYRTEIGPRFTSGTGNTIDSTWAMPRKFAGDAGWGEMNYLGYIAQKDAPANSTPGQAQRGEPLNRNLGRGELGYFLDTVVGASLYGDMPAAIENFLAARISKARGYSADWPALNTGNAEAFNASQALRQRLMRELTARGEHQNASGTVEGALLFPPRAAALDGAARYRQVVVTQRYNLGKDVFPETPLTYRYFRQEGEHFAHLNGKPYVLGEVITERPVDTRDPVLDTYLIGNAHTLIDENKTFAEGGTYNPGYLPLLKE